MIFKPKELQIHEEQDNLNITYSWFDAGAIPLFIFSLFWCGFLAVWYTIGIIGGGPLIMFLFPLFHVAVGVGTMYGALTKLFNKTIIDIYFGQMTIVHKPIPWIKGNTQLNQDDIKQFYVKEKIGNKGSRSYDLRAKLKTGADISVLSIKATDSHLVLQLEERLEQFMDITDQPVPGEFGKSAHYYKQKAKQPKQKRKTKHGFNFNYDLENGSTVSVKNNRLTVGHTIQYDWNTGNTDKLFQLTSDQGEDNLLYVRKKGRLYASYVEHELNAVERNRIKFNAKNPADKLVMDGTQYILTAILEGNFFINEDTNPTPIKQWIYTTTNNEVQVRIRQNGSVITINKGKIIPDFYFSDPIADELELKDIEEIKEIQLEEEYRESDNPWNEVF